MALATVKGGKTLAELAQQYDVHPNLINQWRSRLPEGTAVGRLHVATPMKRNLLRKLAVTRPNQV